MGFRGGAARLAVAAGDDDDEDDEQVLVAILSFYPSSTFANDKNLNRGPSAAHWGQWHIWFS